MRRVQDRLEQQDRDGVQHRRDDDQRVHRQPQRRPPPAAQLREPEHADHHRNGVQDERDVGVRRKRRVLAEDELVERPDHRRAGPGEAAEADPAPTVAPRVGAPARRPAAGRCDRGCDDEGEVADHFARVQSGVVEAQPQAHGQQCDDRGRERATGHGEGTAGGGHGVDIGAGVVRLHDLLPK